MKMQLALLLAVVASWAKPAHAYPEMAREGYANCIACHVSPTGSGVLTPYGRELSSAIMSTWSRDGEQYFIYNVIKTGETVQLGGDFRAIQTYQNDATQTDARFFGMQADAEGAVHFSKFTVNGSVGLDQSLASKNFQNNLISRHHYLMYQATEETEVRAGKFIPAFGINSADHFISIKQALNFGVGSETYNFEAAYLGPIYDLYVTAIAGRPDQPLLNKETGGALSGSVFVLDRMKIGASGYYGSNSFGSRQVGGPNAILGITSKFVILSELDFQNQAVTGAPTRFGIVNYQKADYELFQGFHPFVTQEFSKLDFATSTSFADTYGVGIRWFPRPHFVLDLVYEKIRDLSQSQDFTDLAFLSLHYYL